MMERTSCFVFGIVVAEDGILIMKVTIRPKEKRVFLNILLMEGNSFISFTCKSKIHAAKDEDKLCFVYVVKLVI